MGKLSHFEFDELFNFKSPFYRIFVYTRGLELTRQDLDSIKNSLRRYSKKYPHASYLYVESTTGKTKKDKVIKREKIKTGKPGAPKTIVTGPEKVPLHVHIAAMGVGPRKLSAHAFAARVSKAINKRFRKKYNNDKSYTGIWSAKNATHAINNIIYFLEQADSKSKHGPFDFYRYENYKFLSDCMNWVFVDKHKGLKLYSRLFFRTKRLYPL